MNQLETILREVEHEAFEKIERCVQVTASCSRPARPAVSGGADPRTAGTGGIERIRQQRTADNRTVVTIEGCILPPLPPDPRFRAAEPGGREFGLQGYDRAHLWGRGFGDEAAAGMMLAPARFNRAWQAAVERPIRYLRTLAAPLGGNVRVCARAISHPRDLYGGNLLAEVRYLFELVLPGTEPQRWTVELTVDPPPSGRVGEPSVSGPPL